GDADESYGEKPDYGREASERGGWGWSGGHVDTAGSVTGSRRLRAQNEGQPSKRSRASDPGFGRRLQLAGSKERSLPGREAHQPPSAVEGRPSGVSFAADGAAKHGARGFGLLLWCQSGSNHPCGRGSACANGESGGGNCESCLWKSRIPARLGEVSDSSDGDSGAAAAAASAASAAAAIATAVAAGKASADLSFSRCSSPASPTAGAPASASA
ncbi:unnamed protein product, partial [Scytosiphon promiscuus]